MDKDNKLPLNYIIPNLFTAASAFLGIISVLASTRGDFAIASIYIILSLIFDGLDGRVARLTNSTSKFGAEFDSLADIVAFGVAPAMLFYFSIGYQFGRIGGLVCALFVVFGAIRLARFNVMSGESEPSVFIGVPIPTAAVVATMWIWLYNKYQFFVGYELYLVVLMVILGFLMVSNIRYPSFKKIDMKRANKIKILVSLTFIFSILYLFPIESATLFVTIYLLYGIIRQVYVFIQAKCR